MIYESRYWKGPLLKSAARLERRKVQRRWPDSSFASVERDLMLGFFTVRRLIEGAKVDPHTRDRAVRVLRYARKPGTRLHRFNRHDIWEAFDLDKPSKANVSLYRLCDQFVHSYVFLCSFDDRRAWDGVFIASDWEKKSSLLWVAADELVKHLRKVGSDSMERIRYEYDDTLEEWRAVRVSHAPSR